MTTVQRTTKVIGRYTIHPRSFKLGAGEKQEELIVLDVLVCPFSPTHQADFCPGRLTWMVSINMLLYL